MNAKQKIFQIIYRLAHLAELYDEYALWLSSKNLPVTSLAEFAKRLEDDGKPYGDSLSLQRHVEASSLVPIFELYELYQKYPGSPSITMEEFSRIHNSVDRFRRDTNERRFIQD